jgi:hypothetical protein
MSDITLLAQEITSLIEKGDEASSAADERAETLLALIERGQP